MHASINLYRIMHISTTLGVDDFNMVIVLHVCIKQPYRINVLYKNKKKVKETKYKKN
jgi:hypothetical protein